MEVRDQHPNFAQRSLLKLLGDTSPGIALASSADAVPASAQSDWEKRNAELRPISAQFITLDKKTRNLLLKRHVVSRFSSVPWVGRYRDVSNSLGGQFGYSQHVIVLKPNEP